MRIAQVAPLFESVPPRLYGGTERVVSYLTEALVGLGHEVTLFASGDSQTRAELMPVCERALWRDPECRETLPQHVRMVELVLRESPRFDVIHYHCDYVHFPLLQYQHTPSVTTLHGAIRPHDLAPLFREHPRAALVSISDSQRAPLPYANWRATVYHGLPRNLFTFRTFRNRPDDYLLFVGRISPEKRLDRAIEIAIRSGRKLKVAAKIYDEDRAYYHDTIEPLLRASRNSVEFLGEVGGSEKDELIGKAYALLFPIDWPEPFGLVMIESLACGTPVIAWRNGSVPEVLRDGVTGFAVESVAAAVKAVSSVSALSRAACRREFETRFDAERMARDYVAVYRRLLGGMPAHAVSPPFDNCQREMSAVAM